MITLVLYFGYEKHWDQPTSLIEALNVTEELKPFVNDIKLNLFEIAWLSREQVSMFRSDFRVVADYFIQMRENGNYNPGTEVLDHIQEVLQLLNVMEQDHRFEKAMNEHNAERKERTMSEWLSRVLKESEEKGRLDGERDGEIKGRIDGEKQAERKMGTLMALLLNQGKTEEAGRAAVDPEDRALLYQEYQIA